MHELDYRVKEDSWIARIAAFKLRSNAMAIVIGKTIHLYNTTKTDFLNNKKWLKHELCHVRQFQRHGFIAFIFVYLFESIRSGYRNNKFEREAREAENL